MLDIHLIDQLLIDHVRSLALAPNDQLLAVGCADGIVQLLTLEPLSHNSTLYHDRSMMHVDGVAFHPHRPLLASCAGQTILLWNLLTGRPAGTIPYPAEPAAAYKRWGIYEDYEHWYSSFDVPDQEPDEDNRRGLGIWYFSSPECLAFNHDGRSLVAGNMDGQVRLWSMQSGALLHGFTGHTRYVRAVAFSPDGRYIVSGGYDAVIRVWDTATGRCVRELHGHTGPIDALTFHPIDDTLASISSDATVRFWEWHTGQELWRIEQIDGRALTWSPNASSVIVGDGQGRLHLWNPTTKQVERTVQTGTEKIAAVHFTQNGRTLVVAGLQRRLVSHPQFGQTERMLGLVERWTVEERSAT